uniref:Cyclin L1 n=2 Tax=Athene cunicularia TaxID=194338 RepID=A0A663MDM7_ATHCN
MSPLADPVGAELSSFDILRVSFLDLQSHSCSGSCWRITGQAGQPSGVRAHEGLQHIAASVQGTESFQAAEESSEGSRRRAGPCSRQGLRRPPSPERGPEAAAGKGAGSAQDPPQPRPSRRGGTGPQPRGRGDSGDTGSEGPAPGSLTTWRTAAESGLCHSNRASQPDSEAARRGGTCRSVRVQLRRRGVAMATGQVLFHRFFYSKSFVKHSFEIVAMACINLASKIEEAPRRIRDVINVFHHLRQLRAKRTPSPLILDQNYINTKNQVIKAERRVLKELGFCVHVKHPHKIIVMYLQVLECERNQTLVQTAWNYMNDSLRTNVFVRFQPETIACACIYLAARALQIPLPTRPHWFLLFGTTEEEIQEICLTTLKLYTRKKPNYEFLDKEVEKRKMALQEAKLKAKGLNPDGTPALSTLGGFSPASKPSSPREVKTEEKSPVSLNTKTIKKEPEERQQASKSPYNGWVKISFW